VETPWEGDCTSRVGNASAAKPGYSGILSSNCRRSFYEPSKQVQVPCDVLTSALQRNNLARERGGGTFTEASPFLREVN
jgi:hypothetical protein